MAPTPETYRIEPLGKQHDRTGFSCGNDDLDRYLRERATQDQRRGVSAAYVLIEGATGAIAGYYTLSATAIEPHGLQPGTFKGLPPYPTVPATLLGRLARDVRYRRSGIGPRLLFDALARSLRVSREIAALGVVVDAIDDDACVFYERYGFVRFLHNEHRLILPMGTIEKLIASSGG